MTGRKRGPVYVKGYDSEAILRGYAYSGHRTLSSVMTRLGKNSVQVMIRKRGKAVPTLVQPGRMRRVHGRVIIQYIRVMSELRAEYVCPLLVWIREIRNSLSRLPLAGA